MPETSPSEPADIKEFVNQHPEVAKLAKLAIKLTDPEETVKNFYAAYRGML